MLTLVVSLLSTVLFATDPPQPRAPEMPQAAAQQFRKAVRRALPSVVAVMPVDSKEKEVGSGIVIKPEGIVVTSAHVIGEYTKVTVILQDKRKFTTDRIYKDVATDVAVIKLDLTGNATLPAAMFGKSDDLETGDWVLAMGSPFGLHGSVTAGIVSAKNRTLGEFRFEDFLQIDAAVNPGNSGGPVINSDGDIVGINAAIKSKSGGFQGVAFAVPSEIVSEVAEELIAKGKISRGYIGLRVDNSDTTKALLVKGVSSETSPAAKAGLLAGDLVTSIDGIETPDTQALGRVMRKVKPGASLLFQITRNGQPQQLTVTAITQP